MFLILKSFICKLADMKSLHYKYIFFLFLLELISGSCTKEVYLPDLEGNMVGYVYCFKEFESGPLSDNNRVLVKAFGKEDTYFTYSDNKGRFEFEDIPAGTYELQFLKDGYGTLKQFDIKHLGGEPTIIKPAVTRTTGSAFVLHALPQTTFTELKIEHDSLFCRISYPGSKPDALYIQLYMSTTENFKTNSANYIFTNFRVETKQENYASQFGLWILQRLPFKKGEKVYFKACASPYYGQPVTISEYWYLYGIDTYFDYENNEVVYPALGKESAQYSFIFP
jgi:hypothetical protein